MIYKCFNESVASNLAEKLLDIEAIKLSPDKPFKWASGWNSPIYCDNRLSLSYPELRTLVKDNLAEAIKVYFEDVDAIAGVATAGIPQGALIADKLNLPFLYIRSKSKSHGLTNMIEGRLEKDQKIVVVEDLVSTGGSSLAAVEALRNSGGDVMGMLSIFTYGFPVARQNFEKANVSLIYLSEYSILLELAFKKGLIDNGIRDTLNSWREDPAKWSN